MQSQKIYLSVVIPSYNEAENLPNTLLRIHRFLKAGSFAYEILVVLDGPTDDTRDVLKSVAKEVDNLRVIDRVANRGKGYTVREGMLKASGQVRLFTDADNSTDIAHFERMKTLFDQGHDVVIASRNPKDAPGAQQLVPQPWHKRVIGKIGNAIVQLIAVRGIWDTQCGFKAFRAEAAARIFSRSTIDGWGFDVEVLALAQALGYRIGIIPAQWINNPRSHVRCFDYLRVLGDTFSVWSKFLTRKYDSRGGG